VTALPAWRRPNKYRAVRTEFSERTYASKREARHAAELDLLVKTGEIRAVVPQVSIPVPGTRSRMVIDFMLIMPDGTVRWQDTKGVVTREWKLKQQLVEGAYGITIEIVR
jgi:hypothetical protein